jgi:hypothetical protein
MAFPPGVRLFMALETTGASLRKIAPHPCKRHSAENPLMFFSFFCHPACNEIYLIDIMRHIFKKIWNRQREI